MGLGEASALLVPLQGLRQYISTTVRTPVEGELLKEQTRQLFAVKAETFVRIPLKGREFSAGAGRVNLQLVPCGNSVSYPFNAQAGALMSDAGQPVAP